MIGGEKMKQYTIEQIKESVKTSFEKASSLRQEISKWRIGRRIFP